MVVSSSCELEQKPKRTLKVHILSSLVFCQYPTFAAKVGEVDLFQAQPHHTLEQPHPYLRTSIFGVQEVNTAVLEIRAM